MPRLTSAFLSAAFAIVLVGPATADNVSTINISPDVIILSAPASAQIWIDPNTGCTYTKAQAAGYAPTWHLIVNGASIGGTNAKAGCPAVISGRG